MFTLSKRVLPFVLVALSILVGCSRQTQTFAPKTAQSISGKVVKIADGDTITILDAQNVQHKIRLQGIDAPERRQDFSDASREHLANLVFGKSVDVEYAKTDHYGRLVGKVWIGGNDECLEQIRAGLAWHFKEYEKEQSHDDRQLYAKAEQEARAQRRGLWKDAGPTPPWEYRHHRNGSTADSDPQDDPIAPDHNLLNAPSLNRSSTAAPTPLASHTTNSNAANDIRGNKRSRIYHWPGCPNYDDIAPNNRVIFKTRVEAERALYRAAKNCR
ncbi:MAG TPA: thermonuclease family protein [Pyrinomonadaceae bacterium]|nr:thermonuclease family protein [Pyrinomonadaceae bacterium]